MSIVIDSFVLSAKQSGRYREEVREIGTVIVVAIISVAISIITAASVTILGCCSFRVYMEREINRVGEVIIEQAKKSIRDAYLNK